MYEKTDDAQLTGGQELRKAAHPYYGEGGIRTPGAGFYQHDGLANRCIKPLCHLSNTILT